MSNLRSITRRLVPLSAAALMAAAATGAAAQASAPAASGASTVGMGFQQVVDRVVAQGYADVREVERKGEKLYEVKARDGQGRKVELIVDARSGEILRQEVKR